MKSWHGRLLGAAAIVLIATGAAAQGVRWNDNGTVDLMLGPDYDNAVITATQEELGTLFGPDEKPFEGTNITVLTLNSGPKGGISGPINAFRPVWEELSGGKLDIALTPITDLYAKMMLDLRQGTGLYDAIIVGAFFYGDLVAGKYMVPVDDYMASGEYPQWSYDVMPKSLWTLHHWGDVGYGVLNDADGQVLYYRRDVLSDPEHQAAFKSEYGYDLPMPPKTWQQLLDIAKYFNGKNWDDSDAEPDRGMVLHLKVGEQGHYHFQSLSAPFVITPGDKVDQYHNVYWFDPTDMTPLINSPGHVKALEFLQELHQTGPAAQVGWSLGEAWDYFLRGKSVFVFSWGDVGALCQDKARSKIQGECASAVLPSSDRILGPPEREVGQERQPAAGRQHHRRLLARRGLDVLGPARGRLLLPVADGDQAGVEVARDLRLGRRRPRLQLPDAGAGRRGQDRGLCQGGLGRGRRQGLPARLLR